MDKKRIAIVFPNLHIPYIYESAQRNDVELVAVMPPGHEIPNRYPCVIGYETLSLQTDPEAALRDIEALHDKWRFDAIMTSHEICMVWTAVAARRLGLRGIAPEAAKAARDKAAMRERFRDHGLVTPGFVVIPGLNEIERCEDIEFPCVVKPASAYNSDGVQRVDDQAQLVAAIEVVESLNAETYHSMSWHEGRNFAGVVVEEYIEGPEYVVELFAVDGDVRALSCGYKGHPTGPCFEETVYLSPPPLPTIKIEEIQAVAVAGMRALGLACGPGHCELRLDRQGRPVILEIAARIGGSGCAHLNVEGSTGIDFAGLWFSYLTDRPRDAYWPPQPTTDGRAASSWILPLGGSGVLQSIDGLAAVREHPDCERLLVFAQLGKHYRPYPKFDGFLAFVFGKHRDTSAGQAFFTFLEDTLKVNWQAPDQEFA